MRLYSTVPHKQQEVNAVQSEKPKCKLQVIPENELFIEIIEIRERPIVKDRAPAPKGLQHMLKAKSSGLSILH